MHLLVILICPSRAAAAGAVEQSLAEALAGVAGVSLLRPRDVAALYPVAEVHDPHADELGRLPYTPLYFAALATAAARRIHALAAPPFKLVGARLRRHPVGRHLRRRRSRRRDPG